ncbi:hypothetical protein [uncultured Mailhella sp.]|uniref:hypothetical protein n=1 Tax=uncultured Mailhella sp. TaxID=1981031 RepID=UPI0025FC0527|nr:hypothetical protein [uncultured Mailhella sp.]
MAIIEVSRGLSLNDSCWVVKEGFTKIFAQCNLNDSRFSEILASIAFTGYGSSVRTSVAFSPEFTTNGMLPKCWRRQSGRIYLYKGGTEGASEAGNELCFGSMHGRTLRWKSKRHPMHDYQMEIGNVLQV